MQMIQLAADVDHELRTNIIQAQRKKDDVYGECNKFHK